MTPAKLAEMRAIIDFMRAECRKEKCPIMYVMQTTTQALSVLSPGGEPIQPTTPPHPANHPTRE